MVVHKITLSTALLEETHDIPANSRFLDLQMQNGSLVAWYLTDPKQPMVPITFLKIMTGEQVPKYVSYKERYMGTVQVSHDWVIHVFWGDELSK